MSHRFLADLAPGDSVENQTYLVRFRERRTGDDGAPYVHALLRDRSGNLAACKRPCENSDFERLPEGGFARVSGRIKRTDAGLLLCLASVAPAPIGTYDHANYVPKRQRPARFGPRAVLSAIEKRAYATGLRSTGGLTLPAFIGIGAMKAGSTWLYYNLRRHPALYLPDVKELHYFNKDFHRPLRWYARYFQAGKHRVRGEITPCYSALPAARVRLISRILPDAKILLLMRHPVERAWSHAVSALLTRRHRALEDVEHEEFVNHFRSVGSTRRTAYSTILQNWESAFGRHRVFVGFFQDITRRPKALLADVFRFLGVSSDVDWTQFPHDRAIHKGKGTPLPDAYRKLLHDMYADEISALHERFGAPVEPWLPRQPVQESSA